MYVLRIVSPDKILHYRNTFIITIYQASPFLITIFISVYIKFCCICIVQLLGTVNIKSIILVKEWANMAAHNEAQIEGKNSNCVV